MTFTQEQLIEDLKASSQNATGMFEISEGTICSLMSMLTAPQPLTTSERAELENYRNAQQVVPGELSNKSFEYIANKFQAPISDAQWILVGWNAYRAAMLQGKAEVQRQELTVWYGDMPETNGMKNWTAIIHRKGECLSTGITIDRSEYPDRTRYKADRMRFLIGEITDNPDCLDYDADAHSGYVNPGNSPVIPDGCCIMPMKLTAKNGAKGALSGEFHVTHHIVCQSCGGEGCEDCNEEGGWDGEILIGWDIIKKIHDAAVKACSMPAAPQQESE